MSRRLLLILSAILAGCAGPGGVAPLEEFRLKASDGRELTLRCPMVPRSAASGLYIVQDYCIAIREGK